ncbi:MAG: LytTR family transcriptional regulator [Clostridiales bacterium]|nr:LytTR family transcriptional regulator [Clostridiales bacterium]
MQIEIKIDDSYAEPKIVILTASMTDEIDNLIKKISNESPKIISGRKDHIVEILEPNDLIRIYTNAGTTLAVTKRGEYTLRWRLYEAEQRLNPNQFVRISQSEIINLNKVESFDLGLTGTICVKLFDGTVTYVSRRYVSKIKKTLGI